MIFVGQGFQGEGEASEPESEPQAQEDKGKNPMFCKRSKRKRHDP